MQNAKQKFFYCLPICILFAISCTRLMHRGIVVKKQNNPQVNKPNNPSDNTTSVYDLANFKGKVTKNVVYGSAKNNENINEQLLLDVYEPPNAKGKKFPLIVLMHGGGFKTGDKTGISDMCAGLANNEYVCVSVNYRKGWQEGAANNPCNGDTLQLKQAVYRAIQDAHTALHYLATNASEYSIDKDWVFIGGQSAGAITALFAAYLSQNDADNFFKNASADLGNFDAPAFTHSGYRLRGVISMWGAFINPQLITSSAVLPTIFFQGMKDHVVPFNSAHITRCTSSSLLYGTYPLYNRLKELNETVIAHVDPNGDHGVFTNEFRITNILCFLNDVKQGIKKQEYLSGEQYSCNN